MNPTTIKAQWDEYGYVIIPQLLDVIQIDELKKICDRIWEQWVRESLAPEEAANFTNMAFLTEERYFINYHSQLQFLLNTIANPQIVNLLYQISGRELLFYNTQYFFNPASYTRSGDWHRDQQFDAPDEETEKARMQNTIGIHLHISFLRDNNLEYVPGSHKRWDFPEELEIRKGLNGMEKNFADMPNAQSINLQPGDGVFFDAWGIHRGNYIASIPRRTFDIIYGTPPDWCVPSPTCFLQQNTLEGLSETTRAFFYKFIETYKDKWC
ncbi:MULTISPECIES: phytanoyl-CoA dioxygenase family protein [Kamptonema]|uniref:phytanoyl-CoA dioxygenase family protein n=1 Tax=Kamptonema TaxID=1501433 RepID=UPI0001DACD87|nr:MULTISPECIES: phytanoyl-CoA dioxygenase family protein [Kamptonema]CBN55697.1 hypothetical protein OSCI_2320002 [Kamptonema sp. PCC 6506]